MKSLARDGLNNLSVILIYQFLNEKDKMEIFLFGICDKNEYRKVEHNQDNLVLKMDCEGDEYGIMRELQRENLLRKFHFIMVEWHYRGKEELLGYLRKVGFSYWCNDKNADKGLIYAYNRNMSWIAK